MPNHGKPEVPERTLVPNLSWNPPLSLLHPPHHTNAHTLLVVAHNAESQLTPHQLGAQDIPTVPFHFMQTSCKGYYRSKFAHGLRAREHAFVVCRLRMRMHPHAHAAHRSGKGRGDPLLGLSLFCTSKLSFFDLLKSPNCSYISSSKHKVQKRVSKPQSLIYSSRAGTLQTLLLEP